MKEVSELSEWADSLLEGGDGGEASEEPTFTEPVDELPAGGNDAPIDDLDESLEPTLDDVLARHSDAVEKFKQGGDMDYDLESDLWDYYFTSGDIKNYDADASEFLSQKLADHLGIDESLDESGLQAYLGNKKYGKEGMDALRKAGRDGASKETMAKIRAKYDKLDEVEMEERLAGAAIGGIAGAAITKTPSGAMAGAELGSKLQDKFSNKEVDEGALDTLKKVGKKVLDKIAPGDEELLRQLQKSAGIPQQAQHSKPSMAKPNNEGVAEGSGGVSVRQWANQVRKDHGADVKFRNRQEGGGAVDSVIARNSQGETVGVYNRKTGFPTVFEPKQGVVQGPKEKTQGIALSKAYKKDFDDKKPGHTKPETALTGAYSKTGKPGGPLVKNEGAKVDRMVKHIEKSEKKLGKSKDEAENIAWATANKRGMLDNKNKKAK
jgi:hypothetical protein